MKFLREKLVIIIIIIMISLCVAAMGIAVNLTITMVKRHNQMVKYDAPIINASIDTKTESIDLSKSKSVALYVNGERETELNAFSVDGELLLPLDGILENMGIKIKAYPADDAFQFVMGGRKISLRLNHETVQVDGETVKLKSAPFFSKGNLLVSSEIIKYMKGIRLESFSDKQTAFITGNIEDSRHIKKLEAVRLVNGKATLSGILSDKNLWTMQAENGKNDNIYMSPSEDSLFMLKLSGKTSLLDTKKSTNPMAVKASIEAEWSDNAKYLYWTDTQNKNSYLYDVKKYERLSMGDYYLTMREKALEGDKSKKISLLDFTGGLRFKSITFSVDGIQKTFIERKGKIVVGGNAIYSPDRNKVLFYEDGKGYYIADYDGTKEIYIGDGVKARWINDDEVFMYLDGGAAIFSDTGKLIRKVDGDWNIVGQTPAGDVFYMGNKVLYCRQRGESKAIMVLPWQCDKIYAASVKGPYVAISVNNDNVYYIKDGKITPIAVYGDLLKETVWDGVNTLKQNIVFSPHGENIAVMATTGGFLSVDFVLKGIGQKKKVALSCFIDSTVDTDKINYKWLDDNTFLVYTPEKGWVIDINDQTKVFQWDEKAGSTLKGVIIK